MHVVGVDMTSRPTRAKPLWVCHAELVDDALHVLDVRPNTSFAPLEELLSAAAATGSWIAGLDFPFGLPHAFSRWAGFGPDWTVQAAALRSVGDRGFEALVTRFRSLQPDGQKHPLRECDRRAGAASPINIVHPPVGKMLYQGVLRLATSDVRIVPCRERTRDRIAVEAYPALVARTLVGRASYKGGSTPATRTQRTHVRVEIVEGLRTQLRVPYGLRVEIGGLQDCLTSDVDGDALDSVLCAVQAAWSWTQRDVGMGVAFDADPAEGWIADPHLLRPKT